MYSGLGLLLDVVNDLPVSAHTRGHIKDMLRIAWTKGYETGCAESW